MSGASVYVRYGKIGTEGQTQNTVFEEAAAASKHADKLIAEKIGMGYQELTEIDSKKLSDSTTSSAALTCGSSYFHNI